MNRSSGAAFIMRRRDERQISERRGDCKRNEYLRSSVCAAARNEVRVSGRTPWADLIMGLVVEHWAKCRCDASGL